MKQKTKTGNAKTDFLHQIQDYIACELLVAEDKNPTQKYQLNKIYNQINGFLEYLKKGNK